MKGAVMAFSERRVVTVVVDLAHFTRAVAGMDSVAIAGVIDRFYTEASSILTASGGRVVKYLGDGCLAVFPADGAVEAVGAVEELGGRVRELAAELGLEMGMGANVHACTVAEGEFGADSTYDIIGAGVIHVFRMGGGPGIRISEPVYRKLPSDRRGAWTKHQPPATYTLTAR